MIEEDIFFPEEGKAVIWDGWEVGRVDAADGMVKGKGNKATVDEAVGHSEQREDAREGERWVKGWDC